MKFYIVTVGNLRYRDLQANSFDAWEKAAERYPNATRITVKLEK